MIRRDDPVGLRLQRIQKMHTMLRDAGDVDLKRFLATCSYQMGLTKKTTRSYLQDLVDLDLIEIDEAADVVREVVKK